jgi:putative transcriptional regulator
MARAPRRRRGVIVNRISEIVGGRRLTLTALAERSGLGRDTLSDLYWDKTRRIGLATLAALCHALRCQPGDLFAYTPAAPPTPAARVAVAAPAAAARAATAKRAAAGQAG